MIVTCHNPSMNLTFSFNSNTREWMSYTTESREQGIPQSVMAFVVRMFLKYGQWICAIVDREANAEIVQCVDGDNADKVFAAASR